MKSPVQLSAVLVPLVLARACHGYAFGEWAEPDKNARGSYLHENTTAQLDVYDTSPWSLSYDEHTCQPRLPAP